MLLKKILKLLYKYDEKQYYTNKLNKWNYYKKTDS